MSFFYIKWVFFKFKFIVCDKIYPFVTKLLVDEQKVYSLTNYSSKGNFVYSDHNSLIMNVNLEFMKQKTDRRIIFNYKNIKSFEQFKKVTSKTNKFSNCFLTNEPFSKQEKIWSKLLNGAIHKCFERVRVKRRGPILCKKFQRRKKAIKFKNMKEKAASEDDLSKEQALRNFNKIKSNLLNLNNSNNTQTNIWKIKNKFFPKIEPNLPVAKRNLFGQIISNREELKSVYLENFVFRMRSRPILPHLKNYQEEIESQFECILQLTKNRKFPDWSLDDLNKVLKTLKKSQSEDTMGIVNEIFMTQNIGSNLKQSLLLFFNKIKNTNEIPELFKHVYIKAIPKKKKSPLELSSMRGIFLIPKLKAIFIKLIYNSIIDTLELNLSTSNIGARRNKAPRDHLFVLYSVINEMLRSKHACIDLVFRDIKECFDSLWTKKTLLDLHKNGIDSNLLNVMDEMTKEVKIKIKTPVGITEEIVIRDVILQGETLSSILCTNTMDRTSNECKLETFKYKEKVIIPKMGFVDDILDVTKCGNETAEMNEYTRNSINERKLQLHEDKCVRIHIGKKEKECKELEIDIWKTERVESEGEVKIEDKFEETQR